MERKEEMTIKHQDYRVFDFETFGPLRQDKIYITNFINRMKNSHKSRRWDTILMYMAFTMLRKRGIIDSAGKWLIYYRIRGTKLEAMAVKTT